MTTEQRNRIIIIEDMLVLHGNLSSDNLMKILDLIVSLIEEKS